MSAENATKKKQNIESKCKEEDNSKLIFPKKPRENKTRFSEQEMRFLFVEELVKNYDGFYSVETPTEHKYRFSKDRKKLDIPLIDESGKSGNIDICLYDYSEDKGYQRKYFIEFKAHISKQPEINKDFLKLKYDNIKNTEARLSNYFIHILSTYDSGTIVGLKERYKNALDLIEEKIENDITIFVCMLNIKEKYKSKCGNIISFNLKNYDELEKYIS